MLNWNNVCTQLQYMLPPERLEDLKSNFEVISVKGKKVCVGYFDRSVYDSLISSYNYEIFNAVSTELGQIANIKFKPLAQRRAPAPKTTRSKMSDDENQFYFGNNGLLSENKPRRVSAGLIICTLICVLLCFAIIAVGFNFVQNLSFKETFYSISSTKVHDNLRIIQLSDLHNSTYGSGNKKLVSRINALKPDLIVMTGDCIDQDASPDNTVALCKKLSDIAPTYYIYGNNEEKMAFNNEMTLESLDEKFGFNNKNRDSKKLYKSDSGLKKKLEDAGVKVLFNEEDTVKIGKSKVSVFGTLTANPSAFWPYAGEAFQKYVDDDSADLKVFLAHEPYLFQSLGDESWGNIAFVGHTHGGIARLPRVGAVYEKESGFFPEKKGALIYGKYKMGETSVIVSNGLSNGEILRFDNQPEIVVADVSKY